MGSLSFRYMDVCWYKFLLRLYFFKHSSRESWLKEFFWLTLGKFCQFFKMGTLYSITLIISLNLSWFHVSVWLIRNEKSDVQGSFSMLHNSWFLAQSLVFLLSLYQKVSIPRWVPFRKFVILISLWTLSWTKPSLPTRNMRRCHLKISGSILSSEFLENVNKFCQVPKKLFEWTLKNWTYLNIVVYTSFTARFLPNSWKMYRSDVRHFEYSAQMQVDLNLRIIKQCMDNIRGGCSDDKEDFPMFMVASCRKDVVGHKAELACYGAERRHASNERRKVLVSCQVFCYTIQWWLSMIWLIEVLSASDFSLRILDELHLLYTLQFMSLLYSYCRATWSRGLAMSQTLTNPSRRTRPWGLGSLNAVTFWHQEVFAQSTIFLFKHFLESVVSVTEFFFHGVKIRVFVIFFFWGFCMELNPFKRGILKNPRMLGW